MYPIMQIPGTGTTNCQSGLYVADTQNQLGKEDEQSRLARLQMAGLQGCPPAPVEPWERPRFTNRDHQ